MKTLLTLFVLFFSSLLFADDISDFEIEGMSIGDSALDFFSEKEIKNNLKNYYTDTTYLVTELEFLPSFKVYDAIQLHFKSSDKNYTIDSVTGFLDYPNNINECYDKKNKIYDDITYLFQNMEKDEYDHSHNADKSGKSIASVSEFRNDTGNYYYYGWGRDTASITYTHQVYSNKLTIVSSIETTDNQKYVGTKHVTYDEFLTKRLYTSTIIKETNMYDRAIYDYKNY